MYDRPVHWFDSEAATWLHGRHLPHVSLPDGVHFITLRLADSIPAETLRILTAERCAWLAQNPPPHTPDQQLYLHRYAQRFHKYLDAGHGSCLLSNPELRQSIVETICYGDGQTYSLGDYVIMPNHVHVLVQTPGDIQTIAGTWARISAHKINKAAQRKGQLWQWEPFDHAIRNAARLADAKAYIAANPARLPAGTFTSAKGNAKW